MIAPGQKRSLFGAAIYIPFALVALMWIVHSTSTELGISISQYGLKPRNLSGILGIVTMPFIHGSWSHLINNSIPMLVLGWAIFHFYPTLAWKTFFAIVLFGGAWLWISGRNSYHIGASGLVYGLAAFLFLSGWLRREKKVAALSLLVAFLYGGLWWGVLPIDPSISWEGHLWGAVSGFALAVVFRKQGPQKQEYHWPEEPENEPELALGQIIEMPTTDVHMARPANSNQHSTGNFTIVYHHYPTKRPGNEDKDTTETTEINR